MDYIVIVTGIGAIIGQGIAKSLRKAHLGVKVIGVDLKPNNLMGMFCDIFYRKPQCEQKSPEYTEFWRNLIIAENADLIIPGIDIDLEYFHDHRNDFKDLHGIFCLNQPELIEISRDKWLLGQKLRENGLPFIPGMISGDWEECISELGTPPLLMKPRHGNASRGIVTIYDKEDFLYWRKKVGDNFMIQKIIGKIEEEYTVGVFGYGDGNAGEPFILQRTLSPGGFTQNAIVINDTEIANMAKILNNILHPLGPTNYQFRREKDVLFLLEVNPRISSSTSIRASFGYNEAAMCLDFFLKKQRPVFADIRYGRASRYTEDFIVYDSDNF
jgi:carbamoyl-phosphate synthase large subunit